MGSTYLNEGNHNGAKNPYDAVGRSYLVISNSTLRENYDAKHSNPLKGRYGSGDYSRWSWYL